LGQGKVEEPVVQRVSTLVLVLLVVPVLQASVVATGAGEVRFSAHFPSARQVLLAGEFNDWNTHPAPMERRGDRFVLELALDHGLHEYKFIVDGDWQPDPDNPARTFSESGQPNSAFWLERDGSLQLRADVPDDLPMDVAPLPEAVPLVILWQQHQPWLGDPASDALAGPWLRVHATKDYLDMALRLKDQPTVRAGISLSGTLLFQLDRYYLQRLVPYLDHDTRSVSPDFTGIWKGHTDPWLDLLLEETPDPRDPVVAGRLWQDDWSCLGVSPEMRRRWPRLEELEKRLRAGGGLSAPEAGELLMLFHLAWMDPRFLRGPVDLCTGHTLRVCDLAREESPGRWIALAADAAARRRLVYETGLILQAVLPEHAALMGPGPDVRQVELATTPFAHPILPLLIDSRSAAARQPEDSLPDVALPESARLQVSLSMAQFRRHTGRNPLGMWPGEGALDLAALSLLGEAGLAWTATGDNMPSAGLPGVPQGRLQVQGQPAVLLRETELSRSLGWRYRLYPGRAAATDLVNRLFEEGRKQPGRVIVLVLDGENAWEFYQRDPDGDLFLDSFYTLLAEQQQQGRIRTLAPAEAAAMEPGVPVIRRGDPALAAGFAAGSWINGDLRTWIGEPEENRAWALLAECMGTDTPANADTLVAHLSDTDLFPGPHGTTIAGLLAQGSDWFWWYGSDREAFEGDGTWDRVFLDLLHTRCPETPMPESLLDSAAKGPGAGRTLD
jgi:hypothetical protein